MRPMRTRHKLRLSATAALSASILALAGCGQIYPSTEPANGPANGIKSNVHDVVVGFAQQQLQAPYFAAMQVQAEEIAKEQGFSCCSRAPTKTRSSR